MTNLFELFLERPVVWSRWRGWCLAVVQTAEWCRWCWWRRHEPSVHQRQRCTAEVQSGQWRSLMMTNTQWLSVLGRLIQVGLSVELVQWSGRVRRPALQRRRRHLGCHSVLGEQTERSLDLDLGLLHTRRRGARWTRSAIAHGRSSRRRCSRQSELGVVVVDVVSVNWRRRGHVISRQWSLTSSNVSYSRLLQLDWVGGVSSVDVHVLVVMRQQISAGWVLIQLSISLLIPATTSSRNRAGVSDVIVVVINIGVDYVVISGVIHDISRLALYNNGNAATIYWLLLWRYIDQQCMGCRG